MAVDPRAALDESLGPLRLGPDVTVGPFAVLVGPLEIGEGSRVSAHAVLGAFPKKRGAVPTGPTRIGARVHVGEGVVIDAGTTPRGVLVEDDAMILPHVYVGHDAWIGKGVTIAAHAQLGGRVALMEGANVGLGATLHQAVTVGAFAMIGMRAVVARDVPPFSLVRGMPARIRGLNDVGADRAGFTAREVGRARELLEALAEGTAAELEADRRVDAAFAAFVARARRGLTATAP